LLCVLTIPATTVQGKPISNECARSTYAFPMATQQPKTSHKINKRPKQDTSDDESQDDPTPMEKLRKMGLDPEKISDDQLNKLVEEKVLSNVGKIMVQQAQAAEEEEEKKAEEAKKHLPIPDLRKGATLEPSVLSTFSAPTITFNRDFNGDIAPPPNYSAISAQQWLAIYLNCNLSKGVRFSKPREHGIQHLLLPPNRSMFEWYEAAQVSAEWKVHIAESSNFRHTIEMASVGAFAEVSTPFISGSTEWVLEMEKQTLTNGSRYTQTEKYVSPVGTFRFDIGRNIIVDDEEKAYFRKSELASQPYMSDAKSAAKKNVKFFVPETGKKEYVIGVVALPNRNLSHAMVICDAKEGVDIKRPIRMVKIWNDKGSGKPKQYQLWRPVAPKGFVALSDVPNFRTSKSNGDETWDDGKRTIWCVAEHFVEQKEFRGSKTWDDAGTKANHNGSIWKADGTNFMIGNAGHNTPPNIDYYALKNEYIGYSSRLQLHRNDDDSAEKKSAQIRVNPQFVRAMEKALDESKEAEDFHDTLVKDIYPQFGEMYPLDVQIGLAALRTETSMAEGRQMKDAIKLSVARSLGATYNGVTGEAGNHITYQHTNENGTGKAHGMSTFTVIGGNTANGHPLSITKYRNDPNSWRVIHVNRYVSIFEFLPKALRERVQVLEKKWIEATAKEEHDKQKVEFKDALTAAYKGFVDGLENISHTKILGGMQGDVLKLVRRQSWPSKELEDELVTKINEGSWHHRNWTPTKTDLKKIVKTFRDEVDKQEEKKTIADKAREKREAEKIAIEQLRMSDDVFNKKLKAACVGFKDAVSNVGHTQTSGGMEGKVCALVSKQKWPGPQLASALKIKIETGSWHYWWSESKTTDALGVIADSFYDENERK